MSRLLIDSTMYLWLVLPEDYARPVILVPNGRYQSTDENPKKAYRLARRGRGKKTLGKGSGDCDFGRRRKQQPLEDT